jgi:hypothetical protein
MTDGSLQTFHLDSILGREFSGEAVTIGTVLDRQRVSDDR